jgi:hypothetical protein
VLLAAQVRASTHNQRVEGFNVMEWGDPLDAETIAVPASAEDKELCPQQLRKRTAKQPVFDLIPNGYTIQRTLSLQVRDLEQQCDDGGSGGVGGVGDGGVEKGAAGEEFNVAAQLMKVPPHYTRLYHH